MSWAKLFLREPANIVLLPTYPDSAHRRTFQILFYALRPGFVRTQTPTVWHLINLLVQLTFDVLLVKIFGVRPLIYLIMSSFFAGSLHPCAGHFIAEHYLWDGLEQETYSYYGPLNVLAYNVRLRRSLIHDRSNIMFIPRLVIITNITISLLSHGLAFPLCER